jgi:hypothetical protein
MLDVHPPHAATHTWRDFFIHIATIVIGLLIAVGLEQTVEYIHHRREVAETRKSLNKELDTDKILIAEVTAEFHRFVPILQTDLTVLHFLETHPGAPMSQWPGDYRLITFTGGFNNSSWKTAQQNNIVALMPDEEASRYADIYVRLNDLNQRESDRNTALNDLRTITMEDPDPSHLSPRRLQQAIDALRTCLSMEARLARSLTNFSYTHPELNLDTPTPGDALRIMPYLNTPHSDSDRDAVNSVLKKMFGNGDYFNPSARGQAK